MTWGQVYAALRPVEIPPHAKTIMDIARDLSTSETTARLFVRAKIDADQLATAKRGAFRYYWPK